MKAKQMIPLTRPNPISSNVRRGGRRISLLEIIVSVLLHEEEELISRRPWSDLPIELVELIANRIDSFGGYIRFVTVCKSWWRGIPAFKSRQIQALQQLPWLVTHLDDGTKIVCFMGDDLQLYPVHMPRGNTQCFGSSFGWLMMANYSDGSNYLLNPCNQQKIKLPRSRPGDKCNFCTKAVLTTSSNIPSSISSGYSDGIGVLGINCHCRATMFYPRLGNEENWSIKLRDRHGYADIIFFRGLLYGLDVHHQIFILRFEFGGIHEHSYPQMERGVRFRGIYSDELLYLLESAGELLMLTRSWLLEEHPAPERNVDQDYDTDFLRTVHFGVNRLDDSSVPRWIKMTSLGGRALLVGEACSISVDAAKFSWFGLKPDCIYFTDGNADEYEWREFCLKDEKIRKFSSNVAQIIA